MDEAGHQKQSDVPLLCGCEIPDMIADVVGFVLPLVEFLNLKGENKG